MDKKSYQTSVSSTSSMFNGDVRVIECWYGKICAVRKTNTIKNLERSFYVCPLPQVCLTILVWRKNGLINTLWFWILFCTRWCWKLWIFCLGWWSWRTRLL